MSTLSTAAAGAFVGCGGRPPLLQLTKSHTIEIQNTSNRLIILKLPNILGL
jgi:hypothetical protein